MPAGDKVAGGAWWQMNSAKCVMLKLCIGWFYKLALLHFDLKNKLKI